MRIIVTITLPILSFIAGCGSTAPSQDSNPNPEAADAAKSENNDVIVPALNDEPTTTPIPNDVTYEIIDESTFGWAKRSLDVRLNKKVSQEILRSIAMKLKNSDSNIYERTFITYVLPDTPMNGGYWATTHFNPELEVRILGLTLKQEQALRQLPNDTSREVVGNWLDERALVGHRITIYRMGGKLFMQNTYKDGSSGTDELQEKESPLGRRFVEVSGSVAGDHWILDANGNLQLHDDEGLISTAKKIQ